MRPRRISKHEDNCPIDRECLGVVRASTLHIPPPQPPKSAHNYPRKSTHNHKNKTHSNPHTQQDPKPMTHHGKTHEHHGTNPHPQHDLKLMTYHTHNMATTPMTHHTHTHDMTHHTHTTKEETLTQQRKN